MICIGKGEESVVVVCVKVNFLLKQFKDFEFILIWDMLIIYFKVKERFYVR